MIESALYSIDNQENTNLRVVKKPVLYWERLIRGHSSPPVSEHISVAVLARLVGYPF